MLLEFIRKRFDKVAPSAAQIGARGTDMQSLAVAQVEPPCAEMTRAGLRFLLGNSAAVTGIAPVQVLPTSQPQWVIFNNEASGGKSYFFEELGVFLTSGTPGVGGVLLACIYQLPVPTAANTTGCSVAPAGLPGNAVASVSEKSKAVVRSSPSAITTPAAPTWYPIATNPSPNVTAFAGSVFLEHRNLQGAIMLPPQFGLGLAVVAPAGTTPLFAPFGRWVEFNTDNE